MKPLAKSSRPIHDRAVCRRLVCEGGLTELALHDAEAFVAERSLSSIGHALTELEYLSESALADHYARTLGFERVHLDAVETDESVVWLESPWMAERHACMVLGRRGRALRLAMCDPTDLHAVDDLRAMTGFDADVVVAERSEIRRALVARHGPSFCRSLAQGEAEDPREIAERVVDAMFVDMVRLGGHELRVCESSGSASVRLAAPGMTLTDEVPAPLGRALMERLFEIVQHDRSLPQPVVSQLRLPKFGAHFQAHIRPHPGAVTILIRAFDVAEETAISSSSPKAMRLAQVKLAYDLLEQASAAWEAGDLERTVSDGKRALELAEATFDGVDPEFLWLQSWIGAVSFLRGAYERALAEQTIALDRHQALVGQPDLASAYFRLWVGRSCLALGQPERGREHVLCSLAIHEALVGPGGARLKRPLVDAAIAAWAGGQLAEARALLLRARALPPTPSQAVFERHTSRWLAELEQHRPAPRGVAALIREV